MTTNLLAIKIRTKKLGLLIRGARTYAGKSVAECASYLGVPITRFEAYELGEESPSLPEIENLAEYLDVDFSYFLGGSLLSNKVENPPAIDIQSMVALRQRIIAVLLKQLRLQKGITLEALSEASGLPVERLNAFELGELPVALPELEIVSELLGTSADHFLDPKGSVGVKFAHQKLVEALMDLPQELREFVSKPVNRPYLELAQRLSEVSVEKLRSVAEGLLEITL